MTSKKICFEGIDSSGKTLQLGLLADFLRRHGHRVFERSYPIYDSFFGKHIGELLAGINGESASDCDPMSMALWYALDRWQDYQLNLRRFENAEYVLLNRFTLSSVVYQTLRKNDQSLASWIEELEHEILKLPRPDLYVIFDVLPAMAKRNLTKKGRRAYLGEQADVYESDSSLQSRAAELYRCLGESLPNAAVISCHPKGTLLDPIHIHEEVVDLLEAWKLLV